jgi:DNA-binding winged helix-turn-helix (wHTH) protein/TolB-like protein/Flp pilus assembly protein TadD
MKRVPRPAYEFGGYLLDPTEGRLLRNGRPVALTPKAFQTLVVLVENSGHMVGKDELVREVWPETFVDEAGLTRNISVLRKVLADGAPDQEFIETVPKRGYRFIDSVKRVTIDVPAAVSEPQSAVTGAEELGPLSPVTALDQVEDARWAPAASPVRRTARSVLSSTRFAGVGVVIALCALSAALIWWRPDTSSVETVPDPLTLAVFPFQTLGAERHDDYLGLGMADALITRLSRIDRITVRPTIAVSTYTNRANDPLAAARDLRVGSVLDGNIQRVGDRIRVTVQLVQVQDGRLLWGGTFDERFLDVFSIQDRVSARVAEVLLVALRGDELQRLTRRETQIGAAYEAYLKGRYLANERTSESLAAASASFAEAIARDPRYALAHAGLADAYALLGVYGALPTTEAFPKAKAAAVEALNIDDTIGEAHTTLAFVKTLYEWDWAGGEAAFKRAIQLSPNYSTAHHWYAINLMSTGRARESIAEMQRAYVLDPLSPIVSTDVGEMFFWAGDYERAIAQARKTLEMHPHYYLAHGLLGWAYAHKGEYSQALAEFRKVSPGTDDDGTRVGIAYVAALTNNRVEALQILKELEELGKTRYVSPHHLAVLYSAVGNREQAFESLERSYKNRVAQLNWLKIDPRFFNLRSDRRFRSLMRRLSLES